MREVLTVLYSGISRLMGFVTNDEQVNLVEAMEKRNKTFNVDHAVKAEARKGIEVPQIHHRN